MNVNNREYYIYYMIAMYILAYRSELKLSYLYFLQKYPELRAVKKEADILAEQIGAHVGVRN